MKKKKNRAGTPSTHVGGRNFIHFTLFVGMVFARCELKQTKGDCFRQKRESHMRRKENQRQPCICVCACVCVCAWRQRRNKTKIWRCILQAVRQCVSSRDVSVSKYEPFIVHICPKTLILLWEYSSAECACVRDIWIENNITVRIDTQQIRHGLYVFMCENMARYPFQVDAYSMIANCWMNPNGIKLFLSILSSAAIPFPSQNTVGASVKISAN